MGEAEECGGRTARDGGGVMKGRGLGGRARVEAGREGMRRNERGGIKADMTGFGKQKIINKGKEIIEKNML